MKPSKLRNDEGSLIIWHRPKYCRSGASLGLTGSSRSCSSNGKLHLGIVSSVAPYQPLPHRVRQQADTLPRQLAFLLAAEAPLLFAHFGLLAALAVVVAVDSAAVWSAL